MSGTFPAGEHRTVEARPLGAVLAPALAQAAFADRTGMPLSALIRLGSAPSISLHRLRDGHVVGLAAITDPSGSPAGSFGDPAVLTAARKVLDEAACWSRDALVPLGPLVDAVWRVESCGGPAQAATPFEAALDALFSRFAFDGGLAREAVAAERIRGVVQMRPSRPSAEVRLDLPLPLTAAALEDEANRWLRANAAFLEGCEVLELAVDAAPPTHHDLAQAARRA